MGNITETYEKLARDFPGKVAIQTKDAQVTYLEWDRRIIKTANWLKNIHTKNMTIAILVPNCVSFLQLFTGAAHAEWTVVALDLKWKENELEKRLAVANPAIIITVPAHYDVVNRLHSNVLLLDDCLKRIEEISLDHSFTHTMNPPFYMGFTSGTVGEPKAFIRSHDSWIASTICNQNDFKMNENDHVLIPGALIHSHFLYGAISTLYLGGTVYLLEKFSVKDALAVIETEQITTAFVVPTMVEAMLRENRVIDREFKIISSGAKWLEQTKREIGHLFPKLQRYEFYGASELSFVTALSEQDQIRKPTSVGRPCHGVEIEIRLPDNTFAKPNETGKIFVRSNLVFTGYLDSQTRSIRSLQDADGWITVDDMGYVDEDGFLYMSGREKNMILYGAINIFPEEVEAVIAMHQDVEEVAVLGLADRYWGQIVTAVVKGDVDKIELKKFCRQHLASYKVPRKWYIIEDMPYTTSGKIARADLYKWIEGKVNND